jgi:hypothetical protein
VAKSLELPRPEVRAVAGLDPNDTWFDLRDSLEKLVALNTTAKTHFADLVDSVQLKHVLRKVDTECLDRHDTPPAG